MKSSPPVFHVELLRTAEGEIDDELRAKVVKTCSKLPSVLAVYACRLRQQSVEGDVSERISLAIEPLDPPKREGPSPLPEQHMQKLFETLAPSRGDSLGFPSGRAIEPWKQLGVCLYERPSPQS